MREEFRYQLEVEAPLRAVLNEVYKDAQNIGGVTKEEFYRTLFVLSLENLRLQTQGHWLYQELERIKNDEFVQSNVD